MIQMDPARLGKVAVLYGGESSEREVSLNSGRMVREGLIRAGVDAHLVDTINHAAILELKQKGFDRAFVILHGRGGEDGRIQAVLDWIGIPYTGSGVLACAAAMNKRMSKQIWQNLGLPVLRDRLLDYMSNYAQLSEDLQSDVLAVKPVDEGSSVGVSRVKNQQEFLEAVEKAGGWEGNIMIEPWVQGRELTYAIVGDEVLPSVEIITSQAHPFYDYEAKYIADDTRYVCPAMLSDELDEKMRILARLAFDAVGAKGWGRVDFMLDGDNNPWLLEMNLIPGMTGHSLVPQAAKKAGMSFSELVLRILWQTLEG